MRDAIDQAWKALYAWNERHLKRHKGTPVSVADSVGAFQALASPLKQFGCSSPPPEMQGVARFDCALFLRMECTLHAFEGNARFSEYLDWPEPHWKFGEDFDLRKGGVTQDTQESIADLLIENMQHDVSDGAKNLHLDQIEEKRATFARLLPQEQRRRLDLLRQSLQQGEKSTTMNDHGSDEQKQEARIAGAAEMLRLAAEQSKPLNLRLLADVNGILLTTHPRLSCRVRCAPPRSSMPARLSLSTQERGISKGCSTRCLLGSTSPNARRRCRT
jgi:hypothetical protein